MNGRIVTAADLRGLSPEQGAALWLTRQHGDGVVGDAGLFQSWLEDHANRAAWQRAQQLWALFDDSGADALADLRAEALNASAHRRPAWHLYAMGGLIAAILLIVVAGSLRMMSPRPGAPGPQIAQSASPQFVTGPGERRVISLADGTRVTLDAESTLRTSFSAGKRDVALERGRAFFDVAHDSARPFVVAAGGRAITALGTRFDVQVQQHGLRVALVEGRVRVAAVGAEGVILSPGQQFQIDDGAAEKVSGFAPDLIAWRDEFVEFRGETLAAAALAISRDSDVRIVVSPAVADLRVSGRFRLGDPERFARTVSQILPVKVAHTGRNELTLRPR